MAMSSSASAALFSDDIEPGERDPSGRFVRSDEVLGRGAFKTVYKAFDEIEAIEVAWNQVKIEEVVQSEKQLSCLYSEVEILKSLDNEHILKLYHSWVNEEKKTINMVTELFTSGSLRAYRKKHKNVDLKVIKKWARQILQGLEYLHGHEPAIIHRDLKCDNIFINGNNGEVKIGDLGLAIVLQQHHAHSCIGTPEFMAPELYDEDYDELVDIYSFGMCILEMVTCEYPYSECKNPCQIFKKVSSGIKPASLEKVKDPEVKQFIEKCLLPASMRLPAKELLKDPFLATSSPKQAICESPQLLMPVPEVVNLSESEFEFHPVEPESILKSIDWILQYSPLDFERACVDRGFRIRGEKYDNSSISFTLRIHDGTPSAIEVKFQFYLQTDTPQSVACEMVEQLNLSSEDAKAVAELIEELIIMLAPSWKHSYEAVSCGAAAQPLNGLKYASSARG